MTFRLAMLLPAIAMTTLAMSDALAARRGRELPMTECSALTGKPGSGKAHTGLINVTFENHLDQAVRVYWMDFAGQPDLYFELIPGESYVQETYASHLWLVTDTDDQCVGLFRANNRNTTATIQ